MSVCTRLESLAYLLDIHGWAGRASPRLNLEKSSPPPRSRKTAEIDNLNLTQILKIGARKK